MIDIVSGPNFNWYKYNQGYKWASTSLSNGKKVEEIRAQCSRISRNDDFEVGAMDAAHYAEVKWSFPVYIFKKEYTKSFGLIKISLIVEDRRPDVHRYEQGKYKYHLRINNKSTSFRTDYDYSEDFDRFFS